MNRVFGMLIIVLWLVAMGLLLKRDVLPYWQAQDPPSGPDAPSELQVAIHTEAGQRVGTTWVRTTTLPTGTIVHNLTSMHLKNVSSFLPEMGEFAIVTNLTYEPDGVLQSFDFQLHGTGLPIQVEGYRYGRDYACKAVLGTMTKTIPLDGRQSAYLGESLRPFTHLDGLTVGQTWRMRLLDPLSLMQSQSLDFKIQLVEVTARETIKHNDAEVECFKIETQGAIAWANDEGRVLRQEVVIPLLGRWILTDEPLDRDAYNETSARVQQMAHQEDATLPQGADASRRPGPSSSEGAASSGSPQPSAAFVFEVIAPSPHSKQDH